MSLRITSLEDLEHVSPKVREQLERCLGAIDAAPKPAEIRGALEGKPFKRKPMRRPEEEAGRLLVEWIDLVRLPNGLQPGLFFCHNANGLARSATEGGIFKAQGMRRGWPDYSLDLPLGRFHGLRLELKAEDGAKPDAEQLEILQRLEAVGFKCCVAWGFEDAKRQISAYLDLAR